MKILKERKRRMNQEKGKNKNKKSQYELKIEMEMAEYKKNTHAKEINSMNENKKKCRRNIN